MGVTGVRQQTSAAAPGLVRRVRAVTDLPVGVGLGVSSGAQAAEVAGYADGDEGTADRLADRALILDDEDGRRP